MTAQAQDVQLPVGWDVRRLKFIASCNDEALPETTDPALEIDYVDISSVELELGIKSVDRLPFDEAPSRARRIARDGDTIVSTVRTYLTAISAIRDPSPDLVVSTGFAVLRPMQDLDGRFLSYALQASRFVEAVVANSTGVSYPAINPSELICLPILFPRNKETQGRIADFLDRKTGQIDALIAKKRVLIERLKEKRLAVITQAVSKGVDVGAIRHDTQIPWLGAIPAHWEVTPLGYLVTMSGGLTPSMANPAFWDGETPWVTPKDMKVSRVNDSIDHVSVEALTETSLMLYPPETVLVVVRGMILSHSFPVAITEVPVTINQDMKALRCSDKLIPEYLFWCLTGFSKALSGMAQESAHGTRKIESETIKKFSFPVPPLPEQFAIVESLEANLKKIDRLQGLAEKAIQLQSEHRSALVSAAVLGVIRVAENSATAF